MKHLAVALIVVAMIAASWGADALHLGTAGGWDFVNITVLLCALVYFVFSERG